MLPIGSRVILNTLMDEDDLHITMEEEFERQNPNLDARGGGIIYYDPLAYKIEVYDYIKNTEKPVLVKKEIYRIYCGEMWSNLKMW